MAGLQESRAELPSPPEDPQEEPDECRLWLGNLDTRITEFTLLKLLQKYGTLNKFDFLYNKQDNQPRGYCFVTYSSHQEADKARLALNGKLALSKRIIVKYAHVTKKGLHNTDLCKLSAQRKEDQSSISKETQIRAIEAKLKLMEQSKDDFTINDLDKPSTSQGGNHSVLHHQKPHKDRTFSKPYHKTGYQKTS